jgi:hypothetical protein
MFYSQKIDNLISVIGGFYIQFFGIASIIVRFFKQYLYKI